MKFGRFQIRVALFAVSLASLLLGFRVLLTQRAPAMFNDQYEDLSYGWYVPVMSLYVVWSERRKIRESLGCPSVWGFLLALPFFFAGFLGVRGSQIRLEIVGFVGLLISLTWAFWGRRTAKQILFPALFLLFCIPLHTYLDVVTIHLRMFAVSSAYAILQGFGVDVVREGTMLMSPTGAFSIDVADPCSGMRSLFAMMAVAAGYGYFTQPTWFRRGLLFAASIPIVVFGNVMRIFTIVLTAATCSPDFATGFYHDYSGYVVFLVSIALMAAAGGLITKVGGEKGERGEMGEKGEKGEMGERGEKGERGESCASIAETPLSHLLTISLTLLTVALMAYQSKTVDPVLCEAPSVALGEIAGLTSQPYEPSETELSVLPKDTRFDKRIYSAADGNWYQVSVVIGGKSKNSIHRPELCLPSQGYQMMSPHEMTVGDVAWHRVTLAHKESRSVSFSYTFYNQAGFVTSSHMRRILRDVWDRSVLSRIDRWVMVTVTSSETDDARLAAFLSKLGEFLK